MNVSEHLILKKIEEVAKRASDFFFIQVGGFDGVTDDPLFNFIRSFGWAGIIAEPDEVAFESLKQNYKENKACFFENVAIAPETGLKDFHFIHDPENRLPYWTRQIGSLNRGVVLKHKQWIPDIEKYMVSRKISCLTLSDLLHKHQVKKIDLMCVDTEGSDADIIFSLNFKLYKPSLVLFEHKHLEEKIKNNLFSHLEKMGYDRMDLPTDSLAYIP